MRLLALLISVVVLSVNGIQASSNNAQARNISTLESETQDEPLIYDVEYSYNLFYDSKSNLECVGSLSFSISLPTNTDTFILERTSPHTRGTFREHFFATKALHPATTTELTLPKIYWGTYFRIRALLTDGNSISSPIYAVNDYIDSTDLETLLNQGSSSIENTDEVNIYLNVDNKKLNVTFPEHLSLFVFDLYGKCIFNGDIRQSTTIPLDDVTSPFIIVRYKTSKTTITKKLRIQ